VFVALADRGLNEEGRLAFVLPAALASGEAWANTRKLIGDKYHLETVIARSRTGDARRTRCCTDLPWTAKEGAYMCEADARAAGDRAAMNEHHP
jgi:hypothetical protein